MLHIILEEILASVGSTFNEEEGNEIGCGMYYNRQRMESDASPCGCVYFDRHMCMLMMRARAWVMVRNKQDDEQDEDQTVIQALFASASDSE